MKRDWLGIFLSVLIFAGLAVTVATAQIPNSGANGSGGGGGGGGPVGPIGPLNVLVGPMTGNYDGGGFYTILNMGTYSLIGAPVIYGGNNEVVNGLVSPRVVSYGACNAENDGSSTIATIGSDGGGKFVTLNTPLSSIPTGLTALNDTTASLVYQIQISGSNTTSKLYLNSTTSLAVNDAVSTGTALYCVTPATTISGHLLFVAGGLDQSEASFTLPPNAISGPFLPAFNDNKELGGWGIPVNTAPQAFETFTWPTAANGSFLIYDIEQANLGSPFENTSVFFGSTGNVTSSQFGNLQNTGTADLFLATGLQRSNVVQTLTGGVTQGKGVIEDVLYNGVNAGVGANAPASACANTGQNAFGFPNSTYNNILFTDPQWGGVYQRMIRPGVGGNVDHNMYYTRNSWNSNGTLMLGITSPPSTLGTGNPWIMNLFDANGCFLKTLFNLTGATGNTVQFNWRITWSKTNPNIFYTTGSNGKIILNGTTTPATIVSNDIYAIHPCATANTGVADTECSQTQAYSVDDVIHFSPLLATGANFITTNQPTGPSIDESGGRIGVVTRPTSGSSGDYYFSTVPFTTEPQININDLHTYDMNTNFPSGYCLIGGEIEKTRYTGNGEHWQIEGGQGTGTPTCNTNEFDSAMQLNNDGPGGVYSQTHLYATDQNTPWLNGGGHHSWSPTIAGAPGGGYFVYSHVDGEDLFTGLSCTSTAGNVATCTTTSGNFPVWPSGTKVVVTGVTPSGYNGTWATTSTVGGQSNSVSFQIASNPGAGSGGILKDGFQWETHTIGLDGTNDVTNIEAVNSPEGLTMHTYWPWGSAANGGTAQNWFIQGVGFNNLTQYPAQNITGCTYTGSAPTGVAVCTLANNLPSGWIVPGSGAGQGLGSLGASTVYTSGVTDGGDQCYNGMYVITASTSNTYSYKPSCTPGGSSTANTGTAIVPFTDELWQCYRGDPTNGNKCIPLARTYSAQVTSDFFFEPLPNGTKEGDLVEFDSAPGTAPASSFGKVGDAQSISQGTASYNASGFYVYAGIAPLGTISYPTAGPASGFQVALQPATSANQILTITGTGDVSANGGRYINGGCPQEPGTAEIEGCPMGSVTPVPQINIVSMNAQNNYFNAALTIPTATVTATPALTWPSQSGTLSIGSFFSGNTISALPTSTAVFPLMGAGIPTAASLEGGVQQGISNTVTLSNLNCTTTTGAGATSTPGGHGYVFSLRQNGSNAALTCTIGGAATNCTDSVDTVAGNPGDQFDYTSYPSATPSTGTLAHCSVQVTF